MSTILSYDDGLRIPPMPQTIHSMARPHAAALPLQLVAAAVAGFFLAWVLARFVIG